MICTQNHYLPSTELEVFLKQKTKFATASPTRLSTYIPIIKKFPGRFFSFKLLYVKSNTSKTGKAPNPLGSE